MPIPQPKYRGILINPNNFLFIRFQFNPIIDDNKSIEYGEISTPGSDAPYQYWIKSGLRTINFELMYDTSQNSLYSLFGVLPIRSQFENFLYRRQKNPTIPSSIPGSNFLNSISDSEFANLNPEKIILPPPDVLFMYGPRYWRCKVREVKFTEGSLNSDLIPQNLKVNVSLGVIEFGTLRTIADNERKYLSTIQSVSDGANALTATIQTGPSVTIAKVAATFF